MYIMELILCQKYYVSYQFGVIVSHQFQSLIPLSALGPDK